MKSKNVCRLALTLAIIILGGCAGTGNNNIFGVSKRLETAGRMTLTGANPLFDSENFEEVDLEAVLDPTDLRKGKPYRPRLICGNTIKQSATDKNDDESQADERTACINRAFLAVAISAFYDPKNNEGATPKDRRNRVLDRLLASSEQRCGAYKQYLKAYDIHWETGLGVGTTILGAAGAIATGTVNTRAFSGLAAMLSGARSEIRQGVFSNLASFVIIPGIDFKRSTILTAIKENRKLEITDYTVQAALHDAALYHGACTLESGLEVAQESIKRVENPGLSQINRTLATLAQTKQLAHMVDLASSGNLTAANSKVVAVDYSPQEVVLAGGGKSAKLSSEESIEVSTNTLFSMFDGITQSAREFKAALDAKAANNTTLPEEKIKLTDTATKLAKYFELPAANATPPKNTFVSVRTNLVAEASNIGKIISARDSAIRSDEIILVGEMDTAKRTDAQALIATKKAARDAFSKFALSDLEQKTAQPFQTLSKLVKAGPLVASDLSKVDDELDKLSKVKAAKESSAPATQ
jgi:hypothetical protein